MNQEDPYLEEALWQRLLNVVREVNEANRYYKDELTRNTRVVEDLDLIGDPAFELLEAIAGEFGVDFSTFPFRRYFLREGFFLIPILFWKTEKLHVLKLGMLEKAVRLGRWDTQLIAPD